MKYSLLASVVGVLMVPHKGGNGGGGSIARELANVPLPASDHKVEATGDPANPTPAVEVVRDSAFYASMFGAAFGAPRFKAEPVRKPYVFPSGADAGTEQHGLAEVAFPFAGIPNVFFAQARITKRISPDKKTKSIAMSMPSVSIGPVRHPILNVKEADSTVQEGYILWQQTVIEAYYTFRKAQLAAGIKDTKQTTIAGSSAQVVDDATMTELGL